jgi:putative sugar O-methyltransferase
MSVDQRTLGRAAEELPGLQEMLAELEGAPAVFRPSAFWDHHNDRNLDQIADLGFAAFKRTVNTNYFQWEPKGPKGEGPREDVARRLLSLWLRHPDPRVLRARLLYAERSLHSGSAARWHAICVAALWDYARRRDELGLLDRFSEPALGEPPLVRHRGRAISEDIANSALELATVAQAAGLPRKGSLVVELGAGYGRFAWLLMSAVPGLRYIVCDIPPALAIAQRYLTESFSDLPVFRFRPFADPAAILGELSRARLAFLLPHQLAALPALDAELFVNISSLHEMRHEQIDTWFELIDRHTQGCFYTKQWIRSVNVFDDIVVTRDDYPVPPHWRLLLDREVSTTPGFFESVYRVGRQLG